MSESPHVKAGTWNSIHVIEVSPVSPATKKATYKLTTTIMIAMDTAESGDLTTGKTNLSGSLTRQTTVSQVVNNTTNPHLTNIGHIIEDLETDMRSNLHNMYLSKTREVVANIRSVSGTVQQGKEHTNILNAAVMEHGKLLNAGI